MGGDSKNDCFSREEDKPNIVFKISGDKETLEIAQMVLVGKVNADIVSSINVHSPVAVGLSGGDSNLIEAIQRDSSLGYVGDVKKINPSIVECLMEENLIPVISTIGTDSSGQAYNINSDAVAASLAAALKAERLLYLTEEFISLIIQRLFKAKYEKQHFAPLIFFMSFY